MRIFNFTHHLLDAKYCNAVSGYHVVVDCDCTSSFRGHVKTKELKLLEDNLSFQVKIHCLFVKQDTFMFELALTRFNSN